MHSVTAVRAVGWMSIGLGVAGLAAPARAGRMLGTGERVTLARGLATRDLVIGLGLATRRDPLPWMRARLVSEASDMGMLAVGALAGTFDRQAAARGAVAATALGILDFLLVRRLDNPSR